MRNMFLKDDGIRRFVILIAMAAVAQLAAFILTAFFVKDGFVWNSDSASYLAIAKNILLNRGFYIDASWGPQAFRTPLYPLFIAVFYAILPKIWFVILVQNVLAVICTVLVYRLGKLVFGERVAFFGAALYIFESARLMLTNQLMSETLFVFFVLLAAYYFTKIIIGSFKWPDFVIASASVGLAVLTRPIMQFYPLYILIFFIILGIFLKQFKKYLSLGLLSAAIFLAVVSPWLIRNFYHFGKIQLSSVGGYNLYSMMAIFLEYEAKLRGEDINARAQLDERALAQLNLKWNPSDPDWILKATKLMEPPYEEYFFKEGSKIFLSNPFLCATSILRRSVVFFMESSASRSYSLLVYGMHPPQWIFYPVLYFGGRALWVFYDLAIALSFILFFNYYKKNFWIHLFLFGTILYFAPLSAMFYDVGRFRQPVNPILFLYIANALILLTGRLFKKKYHMSEPQIYQTGAGRADSGRLEEV